jgi:hypothetical protein
MLRGQRTETFTRAVKKQVGHQPSPCVLELKLSDLIEGCLTIGACEGHLAPAMQGHEVHPERARDLASAAFRVSLGHLLARASRRFPLSSAFRWLT